jgi:hypothetical protein
MQNIKRKQLSGINNVITPFSRNKDTASCNNKKIKKKLKKGFILL